MNPTIRIRRDGSTGVVLVALLGVGGFLGGIPERQSFGGSGADETATPRVSTVSRKNADGHLADALESARQAAYDEADLSAVKALRAKPGDPQAEGMRVVIAYVRQYSKLADEALAALDQNDTEIDLGGKYGKAAFVEREGDVLTLEVKGKNKKFTVNDINGMPGARFRITQAFLDRNANAVHDMIIGARLFISQQDDRGRKDPQRSRDMARERWSRAALDATCAEHVRLMLAALAIEK